MISLDLMKWSEVRIAGDQSKGLSLFYVDKILDFFDPPPPPFVDIYLVK